MCPGRIASGFRFPTNEPTILAIQNELATEAVVAAVPFDTGSNLP